GAAYHLSHVSTRERLYAHNPVFGHGSTHHPGARHRTVNQRLRQPWLRYQERRYGRRRNRAVPGQHCRSHQPGWYGVCGQPRGRRAGGVFYLAPGKVSSKNEAFLIPHFGYNRALGNGHSFGLSVFANGGMNTEYSGENGGTFGAGKTGVNLEQLFIAPTWSWEVTDGQGAGFGWDDMTIVKLGWQWQQSNEQTWRAGVSYGEQLIPDEEVLFNILAPGVQEWHFTVGFTHRFSEALEV